MSADLVARGLELFAAGDVAGAARHWLQAQVGGEGDAQLDAYLQHLAAVAPDVLAAVRGEAVASPSDAGQAPVSDLTPPDADSAVLAVEGIGPFATALAGLEQDSVAGESASVIGEPGLTESLPALAAPAVIEPPPLELSPPEPPTSPTDIEPSPLSLEPPSPPSVEEQAAPWVNSPVATPAAEVGAATVKPSLSSAEVTASSAPSEFDLSLFAEPIATDEPTAPPASLYEVSPPPPPELPPAMATRPDPWGGTSTLGPPIVVDEVGNALGLVAAPPANAPLSLPRGEVARWETSLKELLELDDFSGALEIADQLLRADPGHELARVARRRCRESLQRIYESKIGALDAVPRVLIPPEQVIWLDLDHRSGFILAQVDATLTFEELIELTGMDRLEALRIIASLVRNKVVGA